MRYESPANHFGSSVDHAGAASAKAVNDAAGRAFQFPAFSHEPDVEDSDAPSVWSIIQKAGMDICGTMRARAGTGEITHFICKSGKGMTTQIVKLDANTGEEVWCVKEPHGVDACVTSPDTTKVIFSSGKTLTMLDAAADSARVFWTASCTPGKWTGSSKPIRIVSLSFRHDANPHGGSTPVPGRPPHLHVLCSAEDGSVFKLEAATGAGEWTHPHDEAPKRTSSCALCQRPLFANETCPDDGKDEHYFVVTRPAGMDRLDGYAGSIGSVVRGQSSPGSLRGYGASRAMTNLPVTDIKYMEDRLRPDDTILPDLNLKRR